MPRVPVGAASPLDQTPTKPDARPGQARHDPLPAHVLPALALDEELAGDIWDVRRFKQDYPRDKNPAKFKVDFTGIPPLLRPHVKHYFRLHVATWRALTFQSELFWLRTTLAALPADLGLVAIERRHIEDLLPRLGSLSPHRARYALRSLRKMLDYMATSPAWTGPRPARFLVWPEDIPRAVDPLPRPIPPDVLDHLDALLDQATAAMAAGQRPPILRPYLWDGILILRRTGMRFEDLAHLRAPDAQGRHGCLDQDTDGYWWVRIDHAHTKMGKDHRIPTRVSDGVVDAVRRQHARGGDAAAGEEPPYLFRTKRGVLSYRTFMSALEKLSAHLPHEGQPYTIASHQFRHSLATDMIEQGVDIYTVKEFLGHATLAMTERYVLLYLKTLKARYDAYRAKTQRTDAATLLAGHVEMARPDGDADGGWVPDRVGALYISPLPNGIGQCRHLAQLDPCPTVPHCPTCPKLAASRRHLPFWHSRLTHLQMTVDALGDDPLWQRARDKHRQELEQSEKVVAIIEREGVYDGRVHLAETLERRSVPQDRAPEVGPEAPGRV